MAAHESTKATAQRPSSGACEWRELDTREQEFLARTQALVALCRRLRSSQTPSPA
jgi:hypothetical protein